MLTGARGRGASGGPSLTKQSAADSTQFSVGKLFIRESVEASKNLALLPSATVTMFPGGGGQAERST